MKPAERLTEYAAVRFRNRTAAAGVALCAALTLSACSSSDKSDEAKSPDTKPKASSPSGSSTPTTDPQATDEKAALAAYASFNTEQAKAYKKASAEGTELEKYATLNALSKIELDLANMKEAGTVVRGELGHDPDVKLTMKADPPKATIEDCVDLAKYRMYDTKAKKVKPLPTEQPVRYILTAKAERWDGGRWMVTDINPQGGQTC
ncbi:hypothetical protein [Streptomyces sp. NPDC058268]|uniref:hypothetical protein n=1 Tax=Streptomyces sp. NPDC058268 TaxID=3346413 RepID=UPI0036EFA9D3